MSRWAEGRRRRELERQLKALDREYAAWASGPRKVSRERRGDSTTWLSAVAALAGVLAAMFAFPSLVPSQARDLFGIGPDRLAAAQTGSGSGSFTFLQHQPGRPDAPVGYDPCRGIDVLVNPAGAPENSVALVRDAMAEVAEATGLVLRYQGISDERPHWEGAATPTFIGGVQTRSVLVTWATDSEVPELKGKVAGIGGSSSIRERDGVTRYESGAITLDQDSFRKLEKRSDEDEMRAIILHEFGHVVGLGHVRDPHELMNADNVGLLDFGVGDRRGLAAVGRGSCG